MRFRSVSRRRLLRAGSVLAAGAALTACTTPSAVAPTATSAPAAKPAAPAPTAAAAAQPTAVPAAAAKPTAVPAAAKPTAIPAAAGTTAAKGGTFVDVAFADAVTMQPLLGQDNASSERYAFIYPTLLRYNKQLELVGDLAKSYEVSDDKLSISFEIRDDAVWSDGKPISADDVKFTFDKMLDEKVKFPYRTLYAPLGTLTVTGPKALTFKLKEVFAPALGYAGGFNVIPKHIFESVDINDNPHNTNPPVSGGPFALKEWKKDSHATLAANDKYYDGRPNLDAYTFRVVKDQTVSYSMLKTGEADHSVVLAQDAEEAKKHPLINLYEYYYFAAAWDFIGFNLKNPILSDKRVRHALSMGLDKKKMIERIMLGHAKEQYSMYPATSPVFTEDLPKFPFDAAKAKALLDEAGWKAGPDGVRVKDGQKMALRIHFNSGNKRREMTSTIAQQYWKEIGVEVAVEQEEFGAFLKRIQESRDFDMIVLGWVGGYEPHGQSNIWSTGKSQNFIGYSDPKVDELFKQGITVSYDMKERKPIYVEIQKIIAEAQPYIFLFTHQNMDGVNKKVKGIDPDPLGLRWNAGKWSIEPK